MSAGSTVVGGTSAIRVSAGERPSSSTGLHSLPGSTVKVTNPTLLSATLQAVRTPTQSPVRIQTSALQTQPTTQAQQQAQQQSQQGGGSGSGGGSSGGGGGGGSGSSGGGQ